MSADEQTSRSADPVERTKRRGQPRSQVVDPGVSHVKFGRAVEAFRRHELEYRSQGWFLLSAEFPEVFLVISAPQLRPAPVLFGVVIDFVNYDVDPPSVVLVNPWTREPLRARELLSPLPRVSQSSPILAAPARGVRDAPVEPHGSDSQESPESSRIPGSPEPAAMQPPPAGQQLPQIEPGRLMQWWTPESIPFMCMRGVREYHRHPAHTGDAWLLYRGRGEGSLSAILAAIHDHGRAPIRDYFLEFNVQNQRAQHNAFVQQIAGRVRGFLNILPDGYHYPWLF